MKNSSVSYKHFLVFWILILVSGSVLFATPEDETGIYRFGEEEIAEFQADDDFFYLEEDKSETDNTSMIASWFRDMIKMYRDNSFTNFLFQNLHYIILFIAIVFTLIKIGRLEFRSGYLRNSNKNFASVYTDNEDVHNTDFNIAIQKALNQKNYRLAIRFHYLNILKQLSLSGIIEHSIHKTNMEYMYEMKEDNIRNKFKEVAFIFDYIWYGETMIDQADYVKLEPILNNFETEFIKSKELKTN